MSTDLFRFQIKLIGEGYVQVPKTELKTNTFSIEETDVLVNDGKTITRNMFIEDGSYFDKYIEQTANEENIKTEVSFATYPKVTAKVKGKMVLDVSPDLTTQIVNSADVEISNDSAS